MPLPHATRRSSLALAALLTACTGTEPAIVKPTTVVTPPVTQAVAPVTSPVTKPPPAPTPVNSAAPWTTLPEGIVPRALVQDVQVLTADPPILARAAKCDAPKLPGDCNYGDDEVLGFDADSVALVYAPESGPPGTWPLVGEIVGLDGKSRERKTITKTGELEGPAYNAARLKGWKWFAARAKAGYKPTESLLWALGTSGYDEAMSGPLAFLKAPLAGWMLHIDAPSTGDEMTVQLVTPDNKVMHRLATIPVETTPRCWDADAEEIVTCATPMRLGLPYITAVAIDPAGEHLVVVYMLRARGTVESTRWAIYPLPPEARPKP